MPLHAFSSPENRFPCRRLSRLPSWDEPWFQVSPDDLCSSQPSSCVFSYDVKVGIWSNYSQGVPYQLDRWESLRTNRLAGQMYRNMREWVNLDRLRWVQLDKFQSGPKGSAGNKCVSVEWKEVETRVQEPQSSEIGLDWLPSACSQGLARNLLPLLVRDKLGAAGDKHQAGDSEHN